MIIGKFTEKFTGYFYFLFRILVGFFFFQHGAQKLFGWFTENGSVQLASLMGVAGVIEFFGGILLIVGLFTRLVAVISAIEMLVAYFKAHFPSGWIPIANKGELALLFFAAFLILTIYGAKKWSLEKALLKKEIF